MRCVGMGPTEKYGCMEVWMCSYDVHTSIHLYRYGIIRPGEVPEWPNGAVSKTVVALWVTVGSNPTLSAALRVSAKTVS